MLKFGWTPKIKHRNFEYIPRFYDPEKEAFQERLQMLKDKYGDKADLDAEKMKHRIRQGLRSKANGESGVRQSAERSAFIKRVAIIIILSVLCFLILGSDKLEKILNIVTK